MQWWCLGVDYLYCEIDCLVWCLHRVRFAMCAMRRSVCEEISFQCLFAVSAVRGHSGVGNRNGRGFRCLPGGQYSYTPSQNLERWCWAWLWSIDLTSRWACFSVCSSSVPPLTSWRCLRVVRACWLSSLWCSHSQFRVGNDGIWCWCAECGVSALASWRVWVHLGCLRRQCIWSRNLCSW